MDEVFKALADPSRRMLLDVLFQRNGRTLTELQGHLPMTRFGCMKHLKVLEEAGLVTTHKVGREKFHYLNPVPIRLIYERWVSKYAEPWTSALAGLKSQLEEGSMNQKPSHVYEIFIRTTPEQLWQALTDGELTRRYFFGCRVESEWTVGSVCRYLNAEGDVVVEGEVLQVDPPRRLVTTFDAAWIPREDDTVPSTVTWEIEPVGEACRLTLIHDGLDLRSPMAEGVKRGWAQVLSGLKTLLETGEALEISG